MFTLTSTVSGQTSPTLSEQKLLYIRITALCKVTCSRPHIAQQHSVAVKVVRKKSK